MEHHDCQPPGGRQPLDLTRWTCPECGDVWRSEPEHPMDPAPAYDFATAEHVTPEEWRRVGSDVIEIEATWSPEPGGSDLRCSFCEKPRSAVRKLISGPGHGPSRPLICDECVDLCAEIIAEEKAEIEAEQEAHRGKPPNGPTTGAE